MNGRCGARAGTRARFGAGLSRWVRRSLHRPLLLVVLAVGLSTPSLAGAQPTERPNSEEAAKAISVLRSPYCPGFMLEVCPSPQAEALRDSIYDLAAQGMTSDELVEWMIANHGEEWRGLPRRSGAGLLAWIIPPLALLLGIGALVGWLKSSRSRDPEVAPAAEDSLSEAEREKVSAALREWEAAGHEEP